MIIILFATVCTIVFSYSHLDIKNWQIQLVHTQLEINTSLNSKQLLYTQRVRTNRLIHKDRTPFTHISVVRLILNLQISVKMIRLNAARMLGNLFLLSTALNLYCIKYPVKTRNLFPFFLNRYSLLFKTKKVQKIQVFKTLNS